MIVHLDVSQLVLDPRRSGIQRAERELIRHWPGPARLQPCRFDPATGTMRDLPAAILGALAADAPAGGLPAEHRRLAPFLVPGPESRPQRLLNAELFGDPDRGRFYAGFDRPEALFWLVYDFLPWLDPTWFRLGSATLMMPYLRALRAIRNVAFISERTREDFRRRILCGPFDGPVIPMGSDGLGLERQSFDPASRRFVMLGTVEPRKNAAPVMQAFQRLWAAGAAAELVMIGAVAPDATVEIALLGELAAERRFRHEAGLSDAAVRDELRGARAMLFPSEGEGYGIPPMEALHAGIPVVVSAGLPALAGRPGAGQIRLDPPDAPSLADAVSRLLDDATAARLWDEAARLDVPSWKDFARDVASWVLSA